MKKIVPLLLVLVLFASISTAQTFTMGKKCKEALANAQAALSSQSYQDALSLYQAFADGCKTKDAKEQAAVGMAEAYNGLGMYDEAIAQADAALKVTKDRSLAGHFQKAQALNRLGDIEGSKSQLEKVIELTEKNQNTAEKASNYALMAALYDRQMGQTDSALVYLDKARELDPGNVKYTLQEGDMYLTQEDYESAYAAYDRAAQMAPNSAEVYVSKVNAGLWQMNKKYGTTKAQELRDKMTDAEKAAICSDLSKAFELGWKDMNKEMFKALVCN
jgi:tetratricopeptide (TPR) repeat protein